MHQLFVPMRMRFGACAARVGVSMVNVVHVQVVVFHRRM